MLANNEMFAEPRACPVLFKQWLKKVCQYWNFS